MWIHGLVRQSYVAIRRVVLLDIGQVLVTKGGDGCQIYRG